GLTINATTGNIEGTPTEAGTFVGMLIRGADGGDNADTNAFTITIADPIFVQLGQATETNSAQPWTAKIPVAVQMGQAIESDSALPWAVQNPNAVQLGQATETNVAIQWQVKDFPVSVQMGQAVETDRSLPWLVKGLPINVQMGQAIETDTAQPWTTVNPNAVQLGQAQETDTALPWTSDAPIAIQMGQAQEVDTALSWSPSFVQDVQMGQAVEIDAAFSFTPYISEPAADYPYFRARDYRDVYARFLGPLAQDITILLNNGTGFTAIPGARAHVSRWRESDLVQGGPVEVGDLKLIILEESLPDGLRSLEQKDRIEISGRAYGVILWDEHTRSIGDQTMAIEVTVRG
nr:Ig domain-containing protein [Acidimicrobiia bacterium]